MENLDGLEVRKPTPENLYEDETVKKNAFDSIEVHRGRDLKEKIKELSLLAEKEINDFPETEKFVMERLEKNKMPEMAVKMMKDIIEADKTSCMLTQKISQTLLDEISGRLEGSRSEKEISSDYGEVFMLFKSTGKHKILNILFELERAAYLAAKEKE